MTLADIRHMRLVNQQLAATSLHAPGQVVAWLVAMQAQEYAMAKWAIALRLPPGVTDAFVENAFNEGAVLRTHVMRPTWHFVAPPDIRWLLALTAPRVHQANAYYYRKLALDKATFNRANDVLAKSLEGGKHLTRAALSAQLSRHKIDADGLRQAYLFMHAELDAVICSRPRAGKQFTYALLDERVPPVKALARDEALAHFLHRYIISRGPATLQDFIYWSGLTMQEARQAAADLPRGIQREMVQGQQYFYKPAKVASANSARTSFLMPDYDEYGMSYKDRTALTDPKRGHLPVGYNRVFIIHGVMAGGWQRTLKGKTAVVETFPLAPLNKTEQAALDKSIKRFTAFVEEKPVAAGRGKKKKK